MIDNILTSLPYSGAMSSNIGGRRENQDACDAAAAGDSIIVTVCDGMGGGPGGRTASNLAVNAIISYVKENLGSNTDPSEVLHSAIVHANDVLRNKIEEVPELDGMGTTVTAVILGPHHATIAHVGDSRVYQMRGSRLMFRTADHSKVGEMVRSGDLTEEQARLSSFSNIITRALGVGSSVEIDIDTRPYEKGDRFVLCTDGVWGAMPQKELLKEFHRLKSLEGTLDQINIEVEKAGKQKGGGHDNYTAIIIETKKSSILKDTMSKKDRIIFYALAIVCGLSILVNAVFFIIPSPKEIKERNAVLEKENLNLYHKIDSLVKVKSIANVSVTEKAEKEIEVKEDKGKTATQQVKETTKVESPKSNAVVKEENTTEILSLSPEDEELIESLSNLKKEIINLGTMPILPEKALHDKESKRNNIVARFERLILPESCAEEKNFIVGELKKDATLKSPTAKRGSSKQHCEVISRKVDNIIDKIKKDVK